MYKGLRIASYAHSNEPIKLRQVYFTGLEDTWLGGGSLVLKSEGLYRMSQQASKRFANGKKTRQYNGFIYSPFRLANGNTRDGTGGLRRV